MKSLVFFASVVGLLVSVTAAAEPVVTVNGSAITKADVDDYMRSRQVPKSLRETLRKTFAQRLVDLRLMEAYLKSKKVQAKKTQLDKAVQRWNRQMRLKRLDPKAVMKQRGLTEAGLRRELWLPIAWSNYARQVIPAMEIRERFAKQSRQYDGTRIRASQIVRKLPKSATMEQRKKAVAFLRKLHGEISSGTTTFEDAAKKHSQSPSGKQGGDLGFFAYRGTMPTAITSVAFGLKKGEMSQPFVTPFGVHIVKVTEIKPGQLSLEDVRGEVFDQIAKERWNATVATLRQSAKIEWASGN